MLTGKRFFIAEGLCALCHRGGALWLARAVQLRVGRVKLRNRALAPRNRSAAEHQSFTFTWLRGRLPEYNKT